MKVYGKHIDDWKINELKMMIKILKAHIKEREEE